MISQPPRSKATSPALTTVTSVRIDERSRGPRVYASSHSSTGARVSDGRRNDSFSDALRDNIPCPEIGNEKGSGSDEALAGGGRLDNGDDEATLLLLERFPELRMAPAGGVLPGQEQCLDWEGK